MAVKSLHFVLLNHHASLPRFGGGSRHYDLGRELSRRGHRVTVVASSYSQSKGDLFPEKRKVLEIQPGFRFIYLRTRPRYQGKVGRLLNYLSFLQQASRLCFEGPKPDIVMGSSVHPLAWTAAKRLAARYGARFVVEVRDLWPLSLHEDFRGILRVPIFRFFEAYERSNYLKADAIVTTMPYAYEYMAKKYGIDPRKVHHIPHGIDLAQFDRDATSFGRLGESLERVLSAPYLITYTGALSHSEGLETLLGAAKLLQDTPAEFLILGSGGVGKRLERIIEVEGLSKVHMVEKVPRYKVARVLVRSNLLFAGLIHREAFAYGISKNKFYDYMAAAKPIVFASDVRDSLIERAGCGTTVPPGDPKALAKVIYHYMEGGLSLEEQVGEAGRRYVEAHHTREHIAERFLKMVEGLQGEERTHE